ncbi:MAG TPA: hypothetical protein DCX06_13785 [Opitutae bacterium]|nr:hypothetical protein [Opitutae bacterium]
MKRIPLILLTTLGLFLTANAGFKDWGNKALSIFGQSAESGELANGAFGSAEELVSALREALAVSAERALTDLSQSGGFSNSDLYRIPLPKSVESLRKPLALVKREDLLEDFQLTLNRAAEEGVAAAPSVVKDTIQNLSLQDLQELWKGEEDAITRFLEKRSRDQLAERTLPLISHATDSTGATSSYKKLHAALPASNSGFFSKIQSFTGIKSEDLDLDNYVNEQALNALFSAMAAEEKAIRENPAARSTDLLKKLFGR